MIRSAMGVLLVGITLLLSSGCGDEPQVQVWVTSEVRQDGTLASLDFSILDFQAQPSGYEIFADHRVTEEWVQLPLAVDKVDLLAAQSEPVLVASGDLPIGDYDRIFMRPSSLAATTEDGAMLMVKNVMEPIVVAFSYDASGDLTIVLDVIAIATRGEEDYSVFAKSASPQ